jgi:hypothetical protein
MNGLFLFFNTCPVFPVSKIFGDRSFPFPTILGANRHYLFLVNIVPRILSLGKFLGKLFP